MEEGLASTALAPAGGDDQMLQQIIDMLMSGADPEQLIQQGIPAELVRAAVEVIMSGDPSGQGQPPTAPATSAGSDLLGSGGLAATSLR